MRIKILIKIITCFLGIVILYFNYLNPCSSPARRAGGGCGAGQGCPGIRMWMGVKMYVLL
jgi:hypothetical protein